MTEYIRATIAKYEVLEGHDILAEGQRISRYLWNEIWWCAVGHSRKVQASREGKITEFIKTKKYPEGTWIRVRQSLKGKLPKYPGKFAMDKALRDFWAFKNLSDRCASYILADFDIAMRSWFSNLRENPRARPPRPIDKDSIRPLRFEVMRNAKHLGDWTFRLTVLGGHIKERHITIKIHPRPGLKVNQIRLIQLNPDGRAILMYRVKQEKAQLRGSVASIDVGIKNLACVFFLDGESILYNGRGLLTELQYCEKKRAKCKPVGYPHHKQPLKYSDVKSAYNIKTTNRKRLLLNNITRSIVDECTRRGVRTIITGDLTGIRQDKDWGSKQNQQLHQWPFRELARQIEYKAEEVGIEVYKVSERGTSSACPFCGQAIKRKPRGLITCQDCGIVINSDLAGAVNLMQKYLPGFGLGVEAILPSLRSLDSHKESGNPPRISTTFVAKQDLRDMSIKVVRCGARIAT